MSTYMTTNQTIDGVSRKSLEQELKLAAVFDDGGDGADAESARGVVWILRALLDAPVRDRAVHTTLADFCEVCEKRFIGLDGSTKWCPYCGARHEGETVSVASAADQPAPLRIGSGVTVENVGFGSEQERKPYLVFGVNGNLTEVNLINVSLVSKLRTYTPAQLADIGVQVEQPSPVAVVMPERDDSPCVNEDDYYDMGYKDGWNACLDEVTRLNGKGEVS